MSDMSFTAYIGHMESGTALEKALAVLPAYSPEIVSADPGTRLIALSDIFQLYIPNRMSKEIYSKIYLSLLRSLSKKSSKIAVQQHYQNHRAINQQNYTGIIGGSDSFTIIGESGIGKSTAISRAIEIITQNKIIEIDNPFTKIIPCLVVQCPFDSSVKGLLFEILRLVDEQIGSNYYVSAKKARSTTDMLIGAVSQVCLTHIGLLIVDEIQHVVNHKNGKNLVGCLTQLINNTGISICMVGTPESAAFFTQAMQLARRSLGIWYDSLSYGTEFEEFCRVLYTYQYVKNASPLSSGIIQWLYEHSNGNLSIVVSLFHDAQEMAILDGSDYLTIQALDSAYKSRMGMLHGYVEIPTKKQVTKITMTNPILKASDNESDPEISIAMIIQRAKNECKNIVAELQKYIQVEEVKI